MEPRNLPIHPAWQIWFCQTSTFRIVHASNLLHAIKIILHYRFAFACAIVALAILLMFLNMLMPFHHPIPIPIRALGKWHPRKERQSYHHDPTENFLFLVYISNPKLVFFAHDVPRDVPEQRELTATAYYWPYAHLGFQMYSWLLISIYFKNDLIFSMIEWTLVGAEFLIIRRSVEVPRIYDVSAVSCKEGWNDVNWRWGVWFEIKNLISGLPLWFHLTLLYFDFRRYLPIPPYNRLRKMPM